MSCSSSFENASYYLQAFWALLSIIGCTYTILLYNLQANLKIYSFRIICYLSMSVWLFSIQFLIPSSILEINLPICKMFAYINNAMGILSFTWITCMAITIYSIVVKSILNPEKYEKHWICICFSILLLYCIPFITDSYGIIGGNCTFTADNTGNIMRMMFFYVPSWFLSIITVYCYVKILFELKNINISIGLKVLLKRLIYYPVWMLLNVILLTLMMASSYYLEYCDMEIIYVLIYCVVAANGLVNTLIFQCTSSLQYEKDVYSSMASSGFKDRYNSLSSRSLFELD